MKKQLLKNMTMRYKREKKKRQRGHWEEIKGGRGAVMSQVTVFMNSLLLVEGHDYQLDGNVLRFNMMRDILTPPRQIDLNSATRQELLDWHVNEGANKEKYKHYTTVKLRTLAYKGEVLSVSYHTKESMSTKVNIHNSAQEPRSGLTFVKATAALSGAKQQITLTDLSQRNFLLTLGISRKVDLLEAVLIGNADGETKADVPKSIRGHAAQTNAELQDIDRRLNLLMSAVGHYPSNEENEQDDED
jgi:hypothetical protein